MHCQIDGPAAYDILINFEQRWLQASKARRLQKLKTSAEDALLKIDRISEIMGMEEVSSVSNTDNETWHIQVCKI